MRWLVVICIGNSMICSDIWHKYTSDISKLLYVISRAVRRVKFGTILKYYEWYLCKTSLTSRAIFCLYLNYPQKVVIFTCRYFKLSWNTTALSQSNCRNFSCSSIKRFTFLAIICKTKYYSFVGDLSACGLYDLWCKSEQLSHTAAILIKTE